jgi:hypothetical protein
MQQLNRLACTYSNYGCGRGVLRAIQPALLQTNRTLKEAGAFLVIDLGDDAIRLLVDGLVSYTTMNNLDIKSNRFTSQSLDDITRGYWCRRNSRRLAIFFNTRGVFNDQDITQHFVSLHCNRKSQVYKHYRYLESTSPSTSVQQTYDNIKNNLTRNQQLNRVNLLLAQPPPQRRQRQQQHAFSSVMLKISHKGHCKFCQGQKQQYSWSQFYF